MISDSRFQDFRGRDTHRGLTAGLQTGGRLPGIPATPNGHAHWPAPLKTAGFVWEMDLFLIGFSDTFEEWRTESFERL
jgi:hypothetical protein